MNRIPIPSRRTPITSFQVEHGLAFLTVLLSLSAAAIGQNQSEVQSSIPGSSIHVTQVLGFEDVKHNATGELKIQGGVMQFQHNGNTAAQVNISSIQDILVEDEDKQTGDTAMTLAKTAAPYGGGRVVSPHPGFHRYVATVAQKLSFDLPTDRQGRESGTGMAVWKSHSMGWAYSTRPRYV